MSLFKARCSKCKTPKSKMIKVENIECRCNIMRTYHIYDRVCTTYVTQALFDFTFDVTEPGEEPAIINDACDALLVIESNEPTHENGKEPKDMRAVRFERKISLTDGCQYDRLGFKITLHFRYPDDIPYAKHIEVMMARKLMELLDTFTDEVSSLKGEWHGMAPFEFDSELSVFDLKALYCDFVVPGQ